MARAKPVPNNVSAAGGATSVMRSPVPCFT
jgi:hypothetical protein